MKFSIQQRSSTIFALVMTILSKSTLVHSQLPCPPVPELATVVDTAEKCDCFWTLYNTGDLDLGNPSTFDGYFDDDSVLQLAQTGEYYGQDGISNFISFFKGGEDGLIKDFVAPLGSELLVDMSGTTAEQCVATQVQRRRMPFNPAFLENNQDLCVDIAVGLTVYYAMNSPVLGDITIQRINVWVPDEFFSTALPLLTETVPASEFVCDIAVNECGDYGDRRALKSTKAPKDTKTPKYNKAPKDSTKAPKDSTKAPKKTKETKAPKSTKVLKQTKAPKSTQAPEQADAMTQCLEDYKALPSFETNEDVSYIDGDTKGCLAFLSFSASSNSDYCAADKCVESAVVAPSDLFTLQQFGSIQFGVTLLGLDGNSGIDMKSEQCTFD